MKSQRQTPKVSVCVITYNQEAFIGECLQSIVDQETDFDFEVIVGDDASTDGTAKVVRDFEIRYPNRVRAIYQRENVGGGARNFRMVHMAATGEYVAHVDGDDCFLPGKLQSQADILDSRADISFAAHAVRVLDSDEIIGGGQGLPEFGSIYDILRLGSYFVHSSVMYRRRSGGVENFPEYCIDYYMHIERAKFGCVFLDKRTFGLYRRHAASLSQQALSRLRSEKYYEAAFDRAIDLGCSVRAVHRARLDRRMRFAIAHCLIGDDYRYGNGIFLTADDWASAGLKHKVLHLFRRAPWMVRYYFFLKRRRDAIFSASM